MLNLRNWGVVPFVYTDLRLHLDTVFQFTCAVCQNQVDVPLGWALSSEVPTGPFKYDELRELEIKYGGTFQPARCSRCGTDYLVQEMISETSNNAYRVQVSFIWKAPQPPA